MSELRYNNNNMGELRSKLFLSIANADIENIRGKKVLNTLTREKREKIARFLWRRVHASSSSLPELNNKKHVLFHAFLYRYSSPNNLFKSLRAVMRYFVSREKVVNTREFNFDLCLHEMAFCRVYAILKNVSSETFLTREQGERLKTFLSTKFLGRGLRLLIRFNNGIFFGR